MGKFYNVEKYLFQKYSNLKRKRIRVTDDDLNDIRGVDEKYKRSSNLFFLPVKDVNEIFGSNNENVSSNRKENHKMG